MSDPLGFSHRGGLNGGDLGAGPGAVFLEPVLEGVAVDPQIGGDGLDRGAGGVFVERDSVALELLCVGLAWHGGRLPFLASCWFQGVHHPGVRSKNLETGNPPAYRQGNRILLMV